MWLRSSVFLMVVSCYGQTAITQLSSYWQANVTSTDSILWDSKGLRHGMHIGLGLDLPGTVFGGGIRQTPGVRGGVSVPASLVNTIGSFSYGVWCRHNGSNRILAREFVAQNLWGLSFDSTVGGRAQWAGVKMPSGSYNKNAGTLALVWIAYDGSNVKIAVDDSGWVSAVAPVGFSNNGSTATLDFGHNQRQYNSGATVGDVMFWDGYIPTDADRQAIWNSGAGRTYTYFNESGFTPPNRPLTLTLQNQNWLSDTDDSISSNTTRWDSVPLSATQARGLYFLRPYPLYRWNPQLSAILGRYTWVRSTDHVAGMGGVFIGYSDSPEVPPDSWTMLFDAQNGPANPTTNVRLTSGNSSVTYVQVETPSLEWNQETNQFHLYAHSVRTSPASPTYQTTHVWTSPDLTTWTFQCQNPAFNCAAFPNSIGYDHTGYAFVQRVGPYSWRAQTLASSPHPSKFATWISSDGLNWSVGEYGEAQVVNADLMQLDCLVHRFMPTGASVVVGSAAGCVNVFIASDIGGRWQAAAYPFWAAFQHDGTQTGTDFLQDVRAYEENGTVWLYAKWSYQEPSTIRLYKGTLAQSSAPRFGGTLRIGGAASVK